MREHRGLVLAALVAAGLCGCSPGGGVEPAGPSIVPQARTATGPPLDPAPPQVTLDDLRLSRAAVTNGDRDPFRFRQHISVVLPRPAPRPAEHAAVAPAEIPVQQAPAPPIRFIGSLVLRSIKWAIFSDCAGYTHAARRGESFLGEWEVVSIDEESVVVEGHGTGRTRIPMTGCPPR